MTQICEFQHLTKMYHDNIILENISGSIEQGDIVAIVGKSGCGKTTFLNAITGIIPIEMGNLVVLGKDISHKHRKQSALRQLYLHDIAFMFQQGNLIPNKSIFWNLSLPLIPHMPSKADRNQRIIQILEQVGLHKPLNELVTNLSGGEIKRVAFAHALLKPWHLLVLDEPTANLDSETATEISKLIVGLRGGNRTILVASHDPILVSQCNKVFLIENRSMREISMTEYNDSIHAISEGPFIHV